MTPFAIVADLRTGSTLLASSLDRHPQVRCYGELFHTEDLPDNQVEGIQRKEATAHDLLRGVLRPPGVRARGFKAMTFLPLENEARWRDAWERMRAVPGLRVLWLTRRDRLAQFASLEIARHTGVFHPYDDDGLYRTENRPTITIDPSDFRSWVAERDALMTMRRRQLDGLPALELEYEVLVSDWLRCTARVQEFLQVDVQRIEQRKRKQERRPLVEVIANYEQLAGEQPIA